MSAPVRGWVIDGGSLAGKIRRAPRRGSHPHRPSAPWSWLSCSWELLRFAIPQSTGNCGRWRELSHRSYRVKTPILLSASQPFGRACNPHMRTASFRAGPRVYSASRRYFEQASSVGMASKGSVRERAYRGAKPDPAGCNGQLDLEARFKDSPGQFKPVDLCRQVYFGEKHPHVQAGF